MKITSLRMATNSKLHTYAAMIQKVGGDLTFQFSQTKTGAAMLLWRWDINVIQKCLWAFSILVWFKKGYWECLSAEKQDSGPLCHGECLQVWMGRGSISFHAMRKLRCPQIRNTQRLIFCTWWEAREIKQNPGKWRNDFSDLPDRMDWGRCPPQSPPYSFQTFSNALKKKDSPQKQCKVFSSFSIFFFCKAEQRTSGPFDFSVQHCMVENVIDGLKVEGHCVKKWT